MYKKNNRGNYDQNDSRWNKSRQERLDSNAKSNPTWKKKCFICGKEGCWSTKHPNDERRRARTRYLAHCHYTGDISNNFATYLVGYEGHEMAVQQDENPNDFEDETYAAETANYLMNQAYLHQLTGTNVFKEQIDAPANQFFIEDRYSRTVFQGILPDTGAAQVSTAGLEQYLALQRVESSVQLDKSTAGRVSRTDCIMPRRFWEMIASGYVKL
ncbi:hypothetical protein K3495_g14302 [Podosphaera aphanis]|nr:hypothetical protein K3495_g14302 [Podosphaera aphanis]